MQQQVIIDIEIRKSTRLSTSFRDRHPSM
jgi:hypothetical protein